MATSRNSWMPTQGRHQVNIGSSLGRALKARKAKGAPVTAKRSNLPDRDFYSFRYNFKPPSIDSTKPGTIEVKRGQDSTSVIIEHPSSQAGEGHVFGGAEHTAKEMDCVLIYDEETGTYTLEKLDSYMALTYERKTTTVASRVASPAAAPASSKDARRAIELEEELERDLLGLEDADAEGDDDFEEVVPKSIAYREEEEEEEEIAIPPRLPSPPKPKPARAVKPAPKPPQEIPLPPKPKPVQPKLKKNKREPEHVAPRPPLSDAEEEDLEFGKPAKRARPSPPSEGLALPGASSTCTPPPPLPALPVPSHHKQAGSSRAGVIAAVPSPPPAALSESEEEWDEVEPPVDAMSVDGIFGGEVDDGGEEIDVNAFEMELNQEMEESDEDFLAAAVLSEPEAPARGPPMSLKQFAGGEASDDEYSSSDESDDD